MVIVKAPLRVSFFGGSTDYKSYYEKFESLLIGTTIDQFMYTMFRVKPKLLSENSIISYKKREIVKSNEDIEHPLIRETLKFYDIKEKVDLTLYSDIPARTGLGGSSCFCASLVYAIHQEFGWSFAPRKIIEDCIKIERDILGEAGGIQDQIWPVLGGPGAIHIQKSGFFIKTPISLDPTFANYLSEFMLLIYTGEQRESQDVAKSHENRDSELDKREIHRIAEEALKAFSDANMNEIGVLLTESYNFKRKISDKIETSTVKLIIDKVKYNCYGYKLLGSGGGGFVLALADPIQKKKIKDYFGNRVLDIGIENEGIKNININ